MLFFACFALREWRLACPKGELDLVFPNGKGKVAFYDNIIQRGLWPTLVNAGVVTQTGAPKYTGLHSPAAFLRQLVHQPQSRWRLRTPTQGCSRSAWSFLDRGHDGYLRPPVSAGR
jgi:hypothetical protein